jgi:hypothetical protein
MLEIEGCIEPIQWLALSPEPAHEKGKPKKVEGCQIKESLDHQVSFSCNVAVGTMIVVMYMSSTVLIA